MKKIILVLFFLCSGEFVARVATLFDKNIAVKNDSKALVELSQENRLNKILLLGDSYTAGFGIRDNERISTILDSMPHYNLLNLTNGGDNWIDHVIKIDKNLVNLKKNDIIVIGVTWGDALFKKGELKKYFIKDSLNNKKEKNSDITNEKNSVISNNQHHRYYSLVQKVYKNSELVKYLIPNLLNTARRNGILLPVGNFYYLSKFAYSEKKQELALVLKYLEKVSNEYDVKVIIYLYPLFNLLDMPQYLKNYISFYSSNIYLMQSLTIIDGVKHFSKLNDKKYYLSARDGHPNGLAHLKVADTLKRIIELNQKDLKWIY